MKKGIVLTLDLMIAILMSVIIITLLISRTENVQPEMQRTIALRTMADDALTIINKMGLLNSTPSTIGSILNDLITTGYELEIRKYNQNLTGYNTTIIGAIGNYDYEVVKQPFNFENNYGLAILKIRK